MFHSTDSENTEKKRTVPILNMLTEESNSVIIFCLFLDISLKVKSTLGKGREKTSNELQDVPKST